jgi:hypothetical protein
MEIAQKAMRNHSPLTGSRAPHRLFLSYIRGTSGLLPEAQGRLELTLSLVIRHTPSHPSEHEYIFWLPPSKWTWPSASGTSYLYARPLHGEVARPYDRNLAESLVFFRIIVALHQWPFKRPELSQSLIHPVSTVAIHRPWGSNMGLNLPILARLSATHSLHCQMHPTSGVS